MPAPEGRHRYQAALLWERTGTDALGRHTVSSTPVEIRVRWNTNRVQSRDAKGDLVTLDGTMVVGQEIAIGSRVALGTLDVWLESGSGEADTELMEVVSYPQTPDIRNRAQFRSVGLMKFHNP